MVRWALLQREASIGINTLYYGTESHIQFGDPTFRIVLPLPLGLRGGPHFLRTTRTGCNGEFLERGSFRWSWLVDARRRIVVDGESLS